MSQIPRILTLFMQGFKSEQRIPLSFSYNIVIIHPYLGATEPKENWCLTFVWKRIGQFAKYFGEGRKKTSSKVIICAYVLRWECSPAGSVSWWSRCFAFTQTSSEGNLEHEMASLRRSLSGVQKKDYIRSLNIFIRREGRGHSVAAVKCVYQPSSLKIFST